MFSVDFSETAETKSNSFHFSDKKLPLEALGLPGITRITFGQFYQKCRLGPPESEALLDPGRIIENIPEKRGQKQ